jgi:hypothetical protein
MCIKIGASGNYESNLENRAPAGDLELKTG